MNQRHWQLKDNKTDHDIKRKTIKRERPYNNIIQNIQLIPSQKIPHNHKAYIDALCVNAANCRFLVN